MTKPTSLIPAYLIALLGLVAGYALAYGIADFYYSRASFSGGEAVQAAAFSVILIWGPLGALAGGIIAALLAPRPAGRSAVPAIAGALVTLLVAFAALARYLSVL